VLVEVEVDVEVVVPPAACRNSATAEPRAEGVEAEAAPLATVAACVPAGMVTPAAANSAEKTVGLRKAMKGIKANVSSLCFICTSEKLKEQIN